MGLNKRLRDLETMSGEVTKRLALLTTERTSLDLKHLRSHLMLRRITAGQRANRVRFFESELP